MPFSVQSSVKLRFGESERKAPEVRICLDMEEVSGVYIDETLDGVKDVIEITS